MPPADDQGAAKPKPKGGSDRGRRAAPRKGLPSADTVVSESTFTSPKGKVYRVIRTTQMDPYDEPVPPAKDTPAKDEGAPPADKPARKKKKRGRKS